MGDWFPASPSPRAFFSSLINDDIAELPVVGESKTRAPFPGTSSNSDQRQERVGEPQLNSRGSLMERIAARAGFNAPRLNTESIIRPADLSKKPIAQSPFFAVSPGLSPTTLLESPVFLTNSLAWPSPTTGKLLFSPIGNNPNATICTNDRDTKVRESHAEEFAFQPIPEPEASFHYSCAVNEPFPSVSVSHHSNNSIDLSKVQTGNNSSLFEHTIFSKLDAGNCGNSNLFPEQTSNSIGFTDNSPPFDDEPCEDGDQSTGDPNVSTAPAEDGYNWRKYGQKPVKGSEYPRSYYKCSYTDCPVKKKVERSHEGHITEIIYKGAHNHPKPTAANRRSAFGLSNGHGNMLLESEQTGTGDPIWSVSQNRTVVGPADWRDNPPLGIENSNGFEVGDAADGSCTFSNDEEDNDRATHGSVSMGNDGEAGDEFESKRRRIETYGTDMGGVSRALREPRVVVQTTSEVDILDDGYRWRKYGQKVVKGNPNPRSYYKCTSAGCNVRKHVERASHDLKSVITTYEGKHNHDVPAARNNGVTSQQCSAVNQRPEPCQVRNTAARFGRPPVGSFGIQGRPQLEPGAGFVFGMSQAGTGFGGLPIHHPYFGHQPHPGNDMRYMVPKGEPKLEPVTDMNSNSSIGYINRLQM